MTKRLFRVLPLLLLSLLSGFAPAQGPPGVSGVVSSPSITPPMLGGLVLWLDAADRSTLFQDSALTMPVTADNDPVGGWLDKSGRTGHLTQSTAASQPLYKTNVLNGRPVLRGDGADDFLFRTGTLGLRDFTVYAVLKPTSVAVRRDYLGDGTSNSFATNNFAASFASATQMQLFLSATSARTSGTLPVSATARFNVYTTVRSDTQVEFYQGPVSVGTGVTQTLNGYATGRVQVFSAPSTTPLVGDIAEILAYDAPHDTGQKRKIWAYFTRKWGVP